MPLLTVTMKSNGSTSEKDRLSRAIHAASIAAGYREDDHFQRFLSLGPSDLRVDVYYPALPKPRSDRMLMIEVLVSSGTDTTRKKGTCCRPDRKTWRSRHRPKRHNGVFFGDRSCERLIRWRPVRTACRLRLRALPVRETDEVSQPRSNQSSRQRQRQWRHDQTHHSPITGLSGEGNSISPVTNLAFFRARRGSSRSSRAPRLEARYLNYDLHRFVDDADVWFVKRPGALHSVLPPLALAITILPMYH
jgi:hypothetical protein